MVVAELIHQSYFVAHHYELFIVLALDKLEGAKEAILSSDDLEYLCESTNAKLVAGRDIVLFTGVSGQECRMLFKQLLVHSFGG